MELLPIEIKKYILSFLDDRNAREARLVCVDWFKWIKYSTFTIPFANQRLLEQITQRLSTYSWLVELRINRAISLTADCLIRNISQLTQLKSLQIQRGYIDASSTPSNDWYKLSGLTNLETWDCDGLLEGTVDSLLGLFSKLKYANQSHWQKLSGLNTNLESTNTHNRCMSDLPPSLTHLQLRIKDDHAEIDSLSRLTKLKALSIASKETYVIDAKHMTGLDALTTLSMNINGLERCTRLTQLCIDEFHANIKKPIIDISALAKLQALTLTFSNTYDTTLSLPELPRVTSLTLSCHSIALSSLSSSLARLEMELNDIHDYSQLSHLVHLTQLELSEMNETNQTWAVGITCLTQLVSLDLFRLKAVPISLTNLRHLTKLSMTKCKLDEMTLLCLTDLQYLHIRNSPFTREHWQSLEQLSKLTTLIVTGPTNEIHSVDGTSIAHLPLREFIVDVAEIENFWSVVTKLTDLHQLHIPRIESSEQLLLLAPMRLTSLRIKSKADHATEEHLTCLTSLQELIVSFKQILFGQKLTRLYSKMSKGRGKAKKQSYFRICIYKVLKEVNPEIGMSYKAITVIDDFMHYTLRRIAEQAQILVHLAKKKTAIVSLNSRDVEIAVRMEFPSGLVKSAVAEGIKARIMFNAHESASTKNQSQSGTTGTESNKAVIKSRSRANKAGLQFPLSRVKKLLKLYTNVSRISKLAPVYLAAVLEYMCAEVLYIAGEVSRDMSVKRITPRHITLAVRKDEDISQFLARVDICGGGIVPHIHPALVSGSKQSIVATTTSLNTSTADTNSSGSAPKN